MYNQQVGLTFALVNFEGYRKAKPENKARRGNDHVDLSTMHIRASMETCRGGGHTSGAGWPSRWLHANIFLLEYFRGYRKGLSVLQKSSISQTLSPD